jgi:RNA polymerase sigma-70 factor (ECF subfamily)
MNTIIDEYRKNKKYHENMDLHETDRGLEYVSHGHDNGGMESLHEADIKTLIAQLNDTTRRVFMLHVIEGYNHKEIGELLEMTEGTSKWHLSVARKQLRQKLEDLEGIEDKLRKMVI